MSSVLRNGRLTWLQTAAYALPVTAQMLLAGNMFIVLQGVYSKYFGIPLSTLATVLLVTRIFDAVNDPIIGYIADRYYEKKGSRKPFIVAGGLLLVMSGYFLYSPSDNISAVYLLFWICIFFVSTTLIEIPHMAWGGALAADSQGKHRIYAVRIAFSFFGLILFFGLPYLPFFDTAEVTPEVLSIAAITAVLIMIPALLVTIFFVPNSNAFVSRDPTNEKNKKSRLDAAREFARSILENRPLLIVTAAHVCTGMGAGVWFSLLFIFADTYLLIGDQFALAFILGIVASIIALPFWNFVNAKYGIQRAWASSMLLTGLGCVACMFLTPENAGFQLLAGVVVLVYVGLAQFNVAVPTLISNVSDYAEWKFEAQRGATYFAFYAFINKSVAAIGASVGLILVSIAGFEPTATEHSASAVRGLYIVVSLIPAGLFGLSILIILRIPMTERQHSIIRKRLDARISRQTHNRLVADATPGATLPATTKPNF